MITSDLVHAIFTEIEECREHDNRACNEVTESMPFHERERAHMEVHRRIERDVAALLAPLMIDVAQLPRLSGKGAVAATKRRAELADGWNSGLLERLRAWGKEHPVRCGVMFQRVKEAFEDKTEPAFWLGNIVFEDL